MSNRALWDVRQRHVWLAKPGKAKRFKRRVRVRCGMQLALDRKGGAEASPDEAAPEGESNS